MYSRNSNLNTYSFILSSIFSTEKSSKFLSGSSFIQHSKSIQHQPHLQRYFQFAIFKIPTQISPHYIKNRSVYFASSPHLSLLLHTCHTNDFCINIRFYREERIPIKILFNSRKPSLACNDNSYFSGLHNSSFNRSMHFLLLIILDINHNLSIFSIFIKESYPQFLLFVLQSCKCLSLSSASSIISCTSSVSSISSTSINILIVGATDRLNQFLSVRIKLHSVQLLALLFQHRQESIPIFIYRPVLP